MMQDIIQLIPTTGATDIDRGMEINHTRGNRADPDIFQRKGR